MHIVMGESVTVVSAGFSKSGRKKKNKSECGDMQTNGMKVELTERHFLWTVF